jgi:hypothetical protein
MPSPAPCTFSTEWVTSLKNTQCGFLPCSMGRGTLNQPAQRCNAVSWQGDRLHCSLS